MLRFSRYGWWPAVFVTMILLAVASRPSKDFAPSSRPIDDWSMVELVEHLNRMGVEVRLRSTQQNGAFLHSVFLTTIDKDWHALNSLNKDDKRIGEWRGVLHCARVGEGQAIRALHLLGDRCLVVGPFLFYGDAELLRRVHAALELIAP
jgi:hypothetical protein